MTWSCCRPAHQVHQGRGDRAQAPPDFYAVLVGDLRRRPDLARAFYDAGPGSTRLGLAAVLAHVAEAGQLALDDPGAAAEQLFGMWQGFSNFQLALDQNADAVRVFLLAYRDDPTSGTTSSARSRLLRAR